MENLKQIIENIQLNDGLEVTHPLNTTLHILETWCGWNKISYSIFDSTKIVADINNEVTPHEFDVMLKYANSLGYFPAHIYTKFNNKGRKFNNADADSLIKSNLPFVLKLSSKTVKKQKDFIKIYEYTRT